MTENEQKPNELSQEGQESGAVKRRGGLRSSLAAINYIWQIANKPELQIRESDRITAISLILSTITTILCLILHKLNGLSFQLTLLCDFFLGVSLIIYVGNRLGILTALPPRQAALTWQLLQAFIFVGVFVTINLALIMSLILSSISLNTTRLVP